MRRNKKVFSVAMSVGDIALVLLGARACLGALLLRFSQYTMLRSVG